MTPALWRLELSLRRVGAPATRPEPRFSPARDTDEDRTDAAPVPPDPGRREPERVQTG
jgi:hypothetical protein